jgi:hypothetical protein
MSPNLPLAKEQIVFWVILENEFYCHVRMAKDVGWAVEECFPLALAQQVAQTSTHATVCTG